MANTYKSIIITPNRSSNTADPKIAFRGANTSSNTELTLTMYPDSNGTLSIDGSAGQLFSITNDLSNSIFSVNDVSGIPSIEVFANGVVTLAPISGNVGLGNTSPAHKLRVDGTTSLNGAVNALSTVSISGALTLSSALTANSGNGTAGQVLTSNGSGVYWSTVSGGSASANTSGGTGGLQFYNGTTFGSDANLVFSSNRLTVNGTLTVASNNVIFGSGDNTTNAVGITIRGPNANGLNLNGGNVIIAAGNGTGNAGTGAFIDFRTVPNAGSSGNTATTQNTAMRIAGQRVYVGARTDSYSPSNNGGLFIFLNAGGSAVEPAVAVDLDGSFGNVRTRLHSLVTSGAAYVGAQLGTQSNHPLRLVTNQGNYNLSNEVRARLQFPAAGEMGVPAASKIFLDGVDCTGDTFISETAANIIAFTANNAERFRLDGLGNAGLNSNTFGTNAAGVLAIRTTTEPTASVGNVVQFYTSTRTASNTIPAFYCEGSGITNAGIANTTVTNKIAVKINGTIYYLLATTSAT